MPAAPGDAVIAELVLEGHVHRAGEVTLLVSGPAVGLSQLPADIQNRERLVAVQALGQFCSSNQDLVAAHRIDGT